MDQEVHMTTHSILYKIEQKPRDTVEYSILAELSNINYGLLHTVHTVHLNGKLHIPKDLLSHSTSF